MKKILCLALALVLCLALACGAVAEENWKIAILTGTTTQGEEEVRAAERAIATYGAEHIVHDTYPDSFMSETETTISKLVAFASDPEVKAIVMCQAVPGASPAFNKIKEMRDDLIFIAGVPQEDPKTISAAADIVLYADEIGQGDTIIETIANWGCDVFVHYSFPRHLAMETIAARKAVFEANCEALGIQYVEATAPDPTGDAGTAGAQQFILEDVPLKMKEFEGKKVAFFSTNCSMQVPLIEAVFDAGAYFPQPCCPSPYHGFPSAFGIESPSDLVNGITETIEATKKHVADAGLTGHFSTWAVPASIANTVGLTEYAFLWMAGLAPDCDPEIMSAILSNYCGTDAALEPFVDPGTGEVTDNYLVYQLGYLTY